MKTQGTHLKGFLILAQQWECYETWHLSQDTHTHRHTLFSFQTMSYLSQCSYNWSNSQMKHKENRNFLYCGIYIFRNKCDLNLQYRLNMQTWEALNRLLYKVTPLAARFVPSLGTWRTSECGKSIDLEQSNIIILKYAKKKHFHIFLQRTVDKIQ